MLARNIRIEEDLIDQLFNSSEKRLARTLLLLARYGKHDKPVRAVPPISQETLAEMVGTTRSRVNFFMKKFQRLGFIDYTERAQGQQLAAHRRPARLTLDLCREVSRGTLDATPSIRASVRRRTAGKCCGDHSDASPSQRLESAACSTTGCASWNLQRLSASIPFGCVRQLDGLRPRGHHSAAATDIAVSRPAG